MSGGFMVYSIGICFYILRFDYEWWAYGLWYGIWFYIVSVLSLSHLFYLLAGCNYH